MLPRPKMTWPILTEILKHEPSPIYRELFLFLAETGLRPDREALDLRISNVVWKMDLRWVRVEESKTEAGERMVPIPDYLANSIVARLEEASNAESNGRVGSDVIDPLLFPSTVGTRLGYANVIRHWKKLVEASGETYTNLYQLRKLATREFRKDLSDESLIALVGHTDISVTREHYLDKDLDAIAMTVGRRSVKKSVNAAPLGLDSAENESI